MNIRTAVVLLFSVVAAGPALAANPSNAAGDVQAQAASLLKAEAFPPSSPHKILNGSRAGDSGTWASAQTQAANLMKANQTSSSATSRVTEKPPYHGKPSAAVLAKKGTEPQDAQTQARQILEGTSQRSDKPKGSRVLATFH